MAHTIAVFVFSWKHCYSRSRREILSLYKHTRTVVMCITHIIIIIIILCDCFFPIGCRYLRCDSPRPPDRNRYAASAAAVSPKCFLGEPVSSFLIRIGAQKLITTPLMPEHFPLGEAQKPSVPTIHLPQIR